MQQAIATLADRRSLGERQTTEVFGAVMRGEATPAQMAALLMGLRVKGETAEEVAGAARALRDAMVRVEANGAHLVDTCGTGGGAVSTFNISTAAAFVAAGAGAVVAKHGNRSFTSKCGSADVLEALGVRISLDAADAARVLREACVTFLFAPTFHPAMKHAGPVRRELAVASVMNLLGPLANPAGVRRQVVGVAEADRAPLMAGALARLGAEHALVVHGRVGMDEIAPQGITDVWEVRNGRVNAWEVDPADHGLAVDDLAGLSGAEPPANAARIERLLGDGRQDPAGLAALLLNAGAAIYVAGLATSYAEGVARAREVLASGKAREALERLRRATTSTGPT
ncbi:MAG: anthranilate phosphoribosyltransferase [Gemmatimonadetes bacterium]|nr:MAG: anthranilate phosphoribosyltransferase [Gemmatimonadota bacterium]PYP05402.1 MAG: anthranilate phosphoribosyltransferase [Gemmatimonadota bacterium]PYP81921.1 MAG: anthranilate phosphoribosyltransferase [Gemmatimonadota bacterium]